jgi:hypothetical protein
MERLATAKHFAVDRRPETLPGDIARSPAEYLAVRMSEEARGLDASSVRNDYNVPSAVDMINVTCRDVSHPR